MVAAKLGTKFTCYKCSTRFYDLRKPEPLCPKCGADQREAQSSRSTESRRTRAAPAPARPPVETMEPVGDDTELDETELSSIAGDDDEAMPVDDGM